MRVNSLICIIITVFMSQARCILSPCVFNQTYFPLYFLNQSSYGQRYWEDCCLALVALVWSINCNDGAAACVGMSGSVLTRCYATITPRRPDQYHQCEIVIFPVSLVTYVIPTFHLILLAHPQPHLHQSHHQADQHLKHQNSELTIPTILQYHCKTI